MPKRGTVLPTTFEHYEVLDTLGAGGSGEVISARDSTGTIVAIKLLRANQASLKRSRFRNELNFCASNTHPNIIRVIDRGVTIDQGGERPFYVMPKYEKTLRQHATLRLSTQERMQLFSKVLDGVEAAHLRNIFHRDIKPENILLNPNAERW